MANLPIMCRSGITAERLPPALRSAGLLTGRVASRVAVGVHHSASFSGRVRAQALRNAFQYQSFRRDLEQYGGKPYGNQ
jgi:hypothetical protein